LTNDSGFITGITSSMVTTALGYTPGTYSKPSGGIPASDLAQSYYLASNPNGYTSNAGTVTSVAVKMNGSTVGTIRIRGTIDSGSVLTSKPSYNFGEIGAGVATIGDGSNRLMFRTNASYKSGIYYSTPSNEALVFGNINSVTSWIFATVDPTAGTFWASFTPSLQIKNQRVAINKLIASGTDASYNLDVNGTFNATTIYEGGVAIDTIIDNKIAADIADAIAASY
jgi:hypothetical protein